MPVLSPDRRLSEVADLHPTARRGRVWRTPSRAAVDELDGLDRELAALLDAHPGATAPDARRGRVWRTPVAPSARRGRVWRTPETGERTAVWQWIAMIVVAAMIALGAAAITRVDDASTAPVPVGVADSEGRISLRTVAEQVGATELWRQGLSGAGVRVAVLDTGVAPVPALADAVVATVDTSPDAADPALRFVDGYGHGTHMAGVIAGRDDATGFTGIAPGADIVAVKVASSDGSVTPESVITGLDWVTSHADELGIRVITLALDTGDLSDYRTSDLSAAVQRAWAAGIVVVTAAGNGGNDTTGISLPARDPYVITVGGLDTEHGLDVADFATRGDAARTPDVAAPGAHLMSLRAPGSIADREHPEGYVDDELFLASGSSQSAAVVSALVAMMLEARPDLTPDQVKASLKATAQPLAAPASLVGAGIVRGDAALQRPVIATVQTWPRAAGGPVVTHTPGVAAIADWSSKTWSSKTWSSKTWSSKTWSSKTWSSKTWSSKTWSSKTWSSKTWSSKTWSSKTWSSKTWSSKTWSSKTWSSKTWSSKTWSSKTWSSKTWSSKTWSSKTWSSKTWSSKTWSSKTWSSKTWSSKTWSSKTWSSKTWSSKTWSSKTWSSKTWSSKTWSSKTWSSKTWSSKTWSSKTWSSKTWSSKTWSSKTWSSAAWV